MDCSLPGSSIHGIFQARVLEWVAITFSIQGPRKVIFETQIPTPKRKEKIEIIVACLKTLKEKKIYFKILFI